MPDDPVVPLRVVRAALSAACRPHGLEMVHFALVVEDEPPDHVQLVFRLDLERLGGGDDPLSADAFAEMMEGASQAAADTKAQETEASLRRLYGDLGQ